MDHPLFSFLPNGEGEFSTWKVHKSRPTGPKPDKMDDYNMKTKQKVKKKLHAEKATQVWQTTAAIFYSLLSSKAKRQVKQNVEEAVWFFVGFFFVVEGHKIISNQGVFKNMKTIWNNLEHNP